MMLKFHSELKLLKIVSSKIILILIISKNNFFVNKIKKLDKIDIII